MKVAVRYNASLAEITECREEKFEFKAGTTVQDLLHQIERKHGAEMEIFEKGTNKIKPHVWIFVNGQSVTHLGLETVLKDGDQMVLTPPVGGG